MGARPSALTNITLPDTLTKICAHAFAYCEALELVTLPESISHIEENAFVGCEALGWAELAATDGWFLATDEDATSGTEIDVTDPAETARLLTGAYSHYHLKRFSF